MKRSVLIIAALLCSAAAWGQDGCDCFGVVAGKKATSDGSVLFAHNEDDGGEQMLNMYIAGGEGGQARYIWCEFPGMEVADAFMNEYGVAVASDNCPSREDREDFTDGGRLYEIRTNVAKYAKSARDGVRIVSELVERYGYKASGRSYIIADPDEAWVVSLVKGRHWVAQRVPDDEVMIIPNYYVIGEVDLADTANFAASADLISYATERGWYDPARDGRFNFRLAYGAPDRFEAKYNINRHRKALEYILGSVSGFDQYKTSFSYKPLRQLDVMDMINILSAHSDEEIPSGTHPANICRETTVLSTVFQLRNWKNNKDVGCVMWMAPGHPCSEVFIPWYLGMDSVPFGWSRLYSWKDAESRHFSDGKDLRKNYPGGRYWTYVDRWKSLNVNFGENIGKRLQEKMSVQMEIFRNQSSTERRFMLMDHSKRGAQMTKYADECYRKSL